MRRPCSCFAAVSRVLGASSWLMGLVLVSSAGPAFGQAAATAEPATAEPATTAASLTKSVRPGINDNFLDPNLDPDEWLQRFEVESREVFAARDEVMAALALEPGMHVADVGAGTGFYAATFAATVGPHGWVYAVDIAPKFIEHIAKKSREQQITNLSTVLCQPDSVALPPASVDLVFTSDTYHHFEYPQLTLRSIRRALKPGGRLVIVDFERIPGVSREWTLEHVRAGKETVRAEIEEAGFRFEREVDVKGFQENYLIIFRRD